MKSIVFLNVLTVCLLVSLLGMSQRALSHTTAQADLEAQALPLQQTFVINPTLIFIPSKTPTRTPAPVTIGNFVWDDLDKDGIQDAGEPGIAGVTVQVWNSAKNQLLAQTQTNASGFYTLVVPQPGNYYLRAILPTASDLFSPKDQGGDDLRDSDTNPDGFTNLITIASNVISITSIDIGIIVYRPPTATRTPTSINVGNFVWYDINANGIQDGNEPGLGNVVVQLWNATKTLLIASTVSQHNGSYQLYAPGPGDYRIRVLPPFGASITFKDVGNDLYDSDINPSGIHQGFSDILTFPSNLISITSIDIGLINVPATPTFTNTPTESNTPIVTNTPTATDPVSVTPTLNALLPDNGVYLPIVRR